jgi:4-hydroxy-tetrahydrodipicolinate synthase
MPRPQMANLQARHRFGAATGQGAISPRPARPPCYHKAVALPAFHGVVPALVTPFQDDERIDYNAWQTIIDTLIAAGVDGLFAAGSQGEAYALSIEERIVALRFCKQAVAGRVTLYGNVGCPTTGDTVRLAQQAQALGIDAIVVVTPYYIQPSPHELEDHFIEVCRAVRSPVLAYNFPHHGGVQLAAASLARIAARCENLAGVKDSSGLLEQAVAYKNAAPPERPLAVFVGADNLVLAALEQGCAGTVNASANVAPKLYVDLYRAFREGRRDEAARLQSLAGELGDTVMLHTFPSMMKEALNIVGLPAGPCRKPVGPVPLEAREKLVRVLARLGRENFLVGSSSVRTVS